MQCNGSIFPLALLDLQVTLEQEESMHLVLLGPRSWFCSRFGLLKPCLVFKPAKDEFSNRNVRNCVNVLCKQEFCSMQAALVIRRLSIGEFHNPRVLNMQGRTHLDPMNLTWIQLQSSPEGLGKPNLQIQTSMDFSIHEGSGNRTLSDNEGHLYLGVGSFNENTPSWLATYLKLWRPDL